MGGKGRPGIKAAALSGNSLGAAGRGSGASTPVKTRLRETLVTSDANGCIVNVFLAQEDEPEEARRMWRQEFSRVLLPSRGSP